MTATGFGELTAFLGVAVLVIVTPGQDTALVIRNTLLGGRRAGVLTAIGVVAGQGVWTLATSVGLTALLLASQLAFNALKLAGAAYLVVLGAQALYCAIRHRGDARASTSVEGDTSITSIAALRQGLISNLGNPKVAVFFTSLLPQFAGGGQATFARLLALGLVFGTITLVWLTIYAIAITRARRVFRQPAVRRAIEAVTGTVLMALGLRLALERR